MPSTKSKKTTSTITLKPGAEKLALSRAEQVIENRRLPKGAEAQLAALSPKEQDKLKREALERIARNKEGVVHPPHYNRGGIECIDAAEAMVSEWSPQTAYRIGQAFQYLYRHRHSGQAIKDLRKAKFFIEREIEAAEREANAELLPQ